MADKGSPIPVILNKKVSDRKPLEINLRGKDKAQKISREESISFDKIVESSNSEFLITGKTTKIGLTNFLQLIDKHDIGEVEDFHEQEVVVSSDLITRIAMAEVVDEDEEGMKYVDAAAIGIFGTSLFLSIFALFTKTAADIKTFSWILMLVSLVFLGHYTYSGIKSGQLAKVVRIVIKSLSRK